MAVQPLRGMVLSNAKGHSGCIIVVYTCIYSLKFPDLHSSVKVNRMHVQHELHA